MHRASSRWSRSCQAICVISNELLQRRLLGYCERYTQWTSVESSSFLLRSRLRLVHLQKLRQMVSGLDLFESSTDTFLLSGPSTASPSSILDLLFPQPRDLPQPKSASNGGLPFFDLPGLIQPAPPNTNANKQKSSMLGGIDFSQITRLCETMAAANRAKKMGEAVLAAANQPKDLFGWIELMRQVEPMPFETMACQMLERLITNPDEFVVDLMRMIMPPGNGDMFPQFNQQPMPTTSTPAPTSPTPAITGSTAKSGTSASSRRGERHTSKKAMNRKR